MYDFALAHSDIHVLEHICFSAAGTLYWWHLLSPIRARMALTGMGPIVYMSVTKFFVGVLGHHPGLLTALALPLVSGPPALLGPLGTRRPEPRRGA